MINFEHDFEQADLCLVFCQFFILGHFGLYFTPSSGVPIVGFEQVNIC